MRKHIFTVGIVALLTTLLLIAGYFISDNTAVPVKDALEQYQEAVVLLQQSYRLEIEKETVITIEQKQYREVAQIILDCTEDSSGNPKIYTTETIQSGSSNTTVTETYVNGILYLTVQDQSFSSVLSEEASTSRYIPNYIFNSALYKEYNGYKKNDQTEIVFSGAVEGELWAMPSSGKLLDAEGIIYLNADNRLTGAVYTIHYLYGSTEISKEFYITLSNTPKRDILPPEDAETYKAIDYIDGPVVLEKMCGLLLQEESILTQTEEYMFCGAFGDQRTQTDILQIGSLYPVNASIDTSITRSNTSHGDAPVLTKQYQSFINNAYSLTINNSAAETDPGITEAYMREYCQNMLLGTLLLPQYIQNSEIRTENGHFIITFQADEAFAQIITEDICSTLYADPTALTARATKHDIEVLQCTITIDQTTGLPVQAQIQYEGNYTIDSISYPLEYKITQMYK